MNDTVNLHDYTKKMLPRNQELKYDAFISYNSKDARYARRLQKRLEKYRFPTCIKDLDGNIIKAFDEKEYKFRIFRYETDLVAQNLDDGLRAELNQSKYLIVLCTPNSAKSKWVGKEIKHFVDTGRKKRIIAYTVKGNPYSQDKKECFNPELISAFPDGTLLGANWKDFGDDPWLLRKRKAFAKLVCLLIDCPEAFNSIWNRYRISYIVSLIVKSLASILLALSFLLAIKYAVYKVRPFDVTLNMYETNPNYELPTIQSIKATISSAEYTQTIDIDSLGKPSGFVQIPGKMRGDSCSLTIETQNNDYIDLDTTVRLFDELKIPLRRNVDRYGSINVLIKVGGIWLCEREVIVDGQHYQTDIDGRLRINIPLEQQRPTYTVEYKGLYGEIKMPCVGMNQQIILRPKE